MNRILKKIMVTALVFALVFDLSGITGNAASKKKVKLNKTKLTLTVGKTYKLKVKGGKAKSWKSSNKKVATVSKSGKVTAKKAGTAKITVKVNKKKLTCKVKVVKKKAASKKTSGTTQTQSETTPQSTESQQSSGTASVTSQPETSGQSTSTETTGGTQTQSETQQSNSSQSTEASAEEKEPSVPAFEDGPLTIGLGVARRVIVDDSEYNNIEWIWTSSNVDVFTVYWADSFTELSVLEGMHAGEATLTVSSTDGRYSFSCKIIVVDRPARDVYYEQYGFYPW